MRAPAVAGSEINGPHRRNTNAGAKSVVRRQARPARRLMALQKRRTVTARSARPTSSFPSNPAVNGLRSPWRYIKRRCRRAQPTNNTIRGTGLDVCEFSVRRKRPPINKRIRYRVRDARLQKRSPRTEVPIDSIRPVIGRVPGRDSVGGAAGWRSSRKLGLEIQCRIGERQPNLPVDIAQLGERIRRRSCRTRRGVRANEVNGNTSIHQNMPPKQVTCRRVQQHHLAF